MAHRYDSDTTRAELLAAARKMFAEHGYVESSVAGISAGIGLSRGAAYHQFGSKAGLFRAVVEEVQAELSTEVDRRASAATSPFEGLRAGFMAYLDLAQRADVCQIVFVDGPAVLGWDEWRQIDMEHAFGSTRRALQAAMRSREIDESPLDELTHVLLGALNHASLEVGRAADRGAAHEAYRQVIDTLLDGMSN
jgi:AcrR family transcriptional regulator